MTSLGTLFYHKLGPLMPSQAWAPYSITSLGPLFYHKLAPLILSQAWAPYSVARVIETKQMLKAFAYCCPVTDHVVSTGSEPFAARPGLHIVSELA